MERRVVPGGAGAAKKRPRLEIYPPHDAVARRIFDITLQGRTSLDILKTLNAKGIPSFNGKRRLKTTIRTMLDNEAYTGALVWGTRSKDKAEPVRGENAFPSIVTGEEFRRIRKLLGARAPRQVHPRRAVSPYHWIPVCAGMTGWVGGLPSSPSPAKRERG